MLQYKAQREIQLELVSTAVNAVFDKFDGAKINMPALITLALQHLNVQPETWKMLSERVTDYIRSSPNFEVTKGKNGGVKRR